MRRGKNARDSVLLRNIKRKEKKIEKEKNCQFMKKYVLKQGTLVQSRLNHSSSGDLAKELRIKKEEITKKFR